MKYFTAQVDPINGGSLYTIKNGEMVDFKVFKNCKDLTEELKQIANNDKEKIEVEFIGNVSYATYFADLISNVPNIIAFVKGG